ncbi:MAG TPA: energy transducer TonB [Holophaga sp.]|nr:energy transducer TonB [Holophaga sp.]
MSQDPKTNPPPNAQSKETLEDLVYRSSLAAGNRSLKGANPLVTIPLTLVSYVAFGTFGYFLATRTEAGKKVLKTMSLDLTEQADAPPPPPPPPPPAPAAPAAPAPKLQMKEAPPPPPINPNQDMVPEVAPRELPKEDLTMRYASAQSAGSGVPGGGVSGASGPATAGGLAVAGSGSAHVVDFDFSQMKIKFQPPAPPYPPLAKIARIQGTVVVEIVVGPDGIPQSAHAVEGPQQLRQTAEQYAMGWKFEPAMLNGVAQTARFKLTMPFRLK